MYLYVCVCAGSPAANAKKVKDFYKDVKRECFQLSELQWRYGSAHQNTGTTLREQIVADALQQVIARYQVVGRGVPDVPYDEKYKQFRVFMGQVCSLSCCFSIETKRVNLTYFGELVCVLYLLMWLCCVPYSFHRLPGSCRTCEVSSIKL